MAVAWELIGTISTLESHIHWARVAKMPVSLSACKPSISETSTRWPFVLKETHEEHVLNKDCTSEVRGDRHTHLRFD